MFSKTAARFIPWLGLENKKIDSQPPSKSFEKDVLFSISLPKEKNIVDKALLDIKRKEEIISFDVSVVQKKLQKKFLELSQSRQIYLQVTFQKQKLWKKSQAFFGDLIQSSFSKINEDEEVLELKEHYQTNWQKYEEVYVHYLSIIYSHLSEEILKDKIEKEIKSFRVFENLRLIENKIVSELENFDLEREDNKNILDYSILDWLDLSQKLLGNLLIKFNFWSDDEEDKLNSQESSQNAENHNFGDNNNNQNENNNSNEAQKVLEGKLKITVEKDSDLKEIILKNLEKYEDKIYHHHADLRGSDLKQITRRIRNDWFYEHKDEFPKGPPDIIHKNAIIFFDPKTLRIIKIDDPQGLSYSDKKVSQKDILDESFAPDVEHWKHSQIEIKEDEVEELEANLAKSRGRVMLQYDSNMDGVLDEEEKKPAREALRKIVKLEKNKNLVENKLKSLLDPVGPKEAIVALREAICLNDLNIWRATRKKTFSYIRKNLPIRFQRRLFEEINKLKLDSCLIRARRGETFEEWTRRVGELIWEKNKKS